MIEPTKTVHLTAEQIGSIVAGLGRAIRVSHEAIERLEKAGDTYFVDLERCLISDWSAVLEVLQTPGTWTKAAS